MPRAVSCTVYVCWMGQVRHDKRMFLIGCYVIMVLMQANDTEHVFEYVCWM